MKTIKVFTGCTFIDKFNNVPVSERYQHIPIGKV